MKRNLSFIIWPAIAGVLAALLILDLWVLPPGQTAGEPQAPVSYATAVRAASPAVVNIYTAKLVSETRTPLRYNPYLGRFMQMPEQRQRIERSLGSGVIMTKQGHILTNNHVIAGADAIKVMLYDGRSANAMVIGTDTATDLAVLQVTLPDLQPIELGDSDQARVGDIVLAIGNPFDFRNSVTQGIVSALGRFGLTKNIYEDYIQTDAAIHPGSSGGALIDTNGHLLGINTLILTSSTGSSNEPQSAATGIGINLAIPVNLAVFVMQDLIDFGEVIRGWLGVSVEQIGETLTATGKHQTLSVVEVADNSPAQKAGVQVGDVITHINGEPVVDGRLTMQRIAMLKPGETVAISVQRNQQSLDLSAIVGALNQSVGPDANR